MIRKELTSKGGRGDREASTSSRNWDLQILLVQNKDFDLFHKYREKLLRNFKHRSIILMPFFFCLFVCFFL